MISSERSAVEQRGVALLVVMVMVLLAGLIFAGALRTAWFSELITGIEADHQRAYENAQALLRDAALDLQGLSPSGGPCHPDGGAGFERSCRRRGEPALSTAAPWFPQDGPAEFQPVSNWLAARTPSCARGICVPDNLALEFWRAPAGELDKMKAQAARYGEFSGAPSSGASNPLLTSKGWYWVEVLPYDMAVPQPGQTPALLPDADNPYVYRITAIAEGHRKATRAVLQTVLVRKKVDS